MKKLMYIFLALPILTGCKEKKSTGAMGRYAHSGN